MTRGGIISSLRSSHFTTHPRLLNLLQNIYKVKQFDHGIDSVQIGKHVKFIKCKEQWSLKNKPQSLRFIYASAYNRMN